MFFLGVVLGILMSKLTPDFQKKACAMAREGRAIVDIATHLGVSGSTFYYLLSRGRISLKGIYADFVSAFDQAKQDREERVIEVVSRATEGNWKHKQIAEVLDIQPETYSRWLLKGGNSTNGFHHRIVKEIDRVRQERMDRLSIEHLQKQHLKGGLTAKFALKELAKLDPEKWGVQT